jgi:predicted GTPase
MSYGSGIVAAQRYGARELVDPRPYTVGTIAETFKHYPHIGPLLPAMGYGKEQLKELATTINKTDCDAVVVATPINLSRIIDIKKPNTRVYYELQEIGKPNLDDILSEFGKRHNLPMKTKTSSSGGV